MLTWAPEDIAFVEVASRHGHVQTCLLVSIIQVSLLHSRHTSMGATGCRVLSVPIRHDVSLEAKLFFKQLVHDTSVLTGICAVDFVVTALGSVLRMLSFQ
jgi:hypothetical protein